MLILLFNNISRHQQLISPQLRPLTDIVPLNRKFSLTLFN